jgi:hypothetical protein
MWETPMTTDETARSTFSLMAVLIAAMAVVVTASNVLVAHPIQALGLADYLTYGALTYPFAFLVTDLANRRLGPQAARLVAIVGFALAVVLSIWLATPRIAIASGVAFLAAQMIDIGLFNALRERVWWVAPLVSSVIASAVDTALFFSLAFTCGPVPVLGVTVDQALASLGVGSVCEGLPWVTLALADYGVKLMLALIALAPYFALKGEDRARPSPA